MDLGDKEGWGRGSDHFKEGGQGRPPGGGDSLTHGEEPGLAVRNAE